MSNWTPVRRTRRARLICKVLGRHDYLPITVGFRADSSPVYLRGGAEQVCVRCAHSIEVAA